MTINTDGNLNLILAWRRGVHADGAKITIGGDVESTLRDFVTRCADNISLDAQPYSPDSPPEEDGGQALADRDEALDTELLAVLERGTGQTSATPDDYERAIACWAVVVGDGDGDDQTLYVHRFSPVQLARKPLVTGFLGDKLTRMTDPVLAFDGKFDFVIAGDKIHVLNQKNFEALFKESEAVLAKVDEWSDSFTAVLPVTEESAAELADAIRSNSVLRRKVTAALRSPHMQKKISAEVLESKLTEQGLDLATHMKDGQLAFTKDTIPTLVRFINDDLFKGTFSEQRFAASGKHQI